MFFGFTFPVPDPFLIDRGPIVIRWYGFLIASAVLIGATLSQQLAKLRQINPDLLADLAIWLVVAAIPGARIYYVLFEWQQYSQNPGEIIAIWKGGIAIHGAIIGGTIAALIFARLNRVSLWQLLDLVVPSLALGQAIGRWGNYFNSEAFGAPVDPSWPLKLYIPYNNRPVEFRDQEYFHPTFFYESCWDLLLFAFLLYLFFWGLRHREQLKSGTMTLIYLVFYSFGRFWIEALRTDSLMLGPLKMAQVISLVTIAAGIIGLIWLYVLKRPLFDVVSSAKRLSNDAK
jgi:phosphatidylglycerol:prolipoprotein diacylglycerol transferase